MSKKRIVSLAIAICFASPLLAAPPGIPLFKALCVAEKETGFNWTNGAWTPANFKADTKIIAEKIDPVLAAEKSKGLRPIMCDEQKEQAFGDFAATTACYYIRELGSKAIPVVAGAEKCTEYSEKKVLQSISCNRMTFTPDGNFIRFPWHMDIDPSPKNGYKDSLVLTVGKCAKIDE